MIVEGINAIFQQKEIMRIQSIIIGLLFIVSFSCADNNHDKWKLKKQSGYTLLFTNTDQQNIDEYKVFFKNGKNTVEDFFDASFIHDFDVYIHPDRRSLDSAWQKDWKMPGFNSQCWMVASGISHKLDIISPKKWDSLSCEHSYTERLETQKLISHEMVHVFHGQRNQSPDFNDISGVDWFIEGLAVYASGQCDSIRMSEVKKAISNNNHPQSLGEFWTGSVKYGLSGTLVMYLDQTFGRDRLLSLLKFNNKNQLLNSLSLDERELINGWKEFMRQN